MSQLGQVTNGRGSGNIERIMGPTEKGCDTNCTEWSWLYIILLSPSLPFKLEVHLWTTSNHNMFLSMSLP